MISVPLSFFGGIGGASKLGVLIKGSNYLETLADVDTVVFDKTGTLTNGTFSVVAVHPEAGYTEQSLLEVAALAESFSDHPIAQSVRVAYQGEVDPKRVSDSTNDAGHGVTGNHRRQARRRWQRKDARRGRSRSARLRGRRNNSACAR